MLVAIFQPIEFLAGIPLRDPELPLRPASCCGACRQGSHGERGCERPHQVTDRPTWLGDVDERSVKHNSSFSIV